MNIIVWNVRGLTDESRCLLKEHSRSFNPVIIGIVEPKVDFSKVPANYWHSINMVARHQNSRHRMCSNIWLLAHPSVATTVVWSSDQTIITDCVWNSFSFRIAVVHGSNCPMDRRKLWIDLLNHTNGSTIFMGDFNAVKGAHERISTVSPNRQSCRDFCEFIEATQFIEPPTSGLKFTWSGRRFLPRHVESLIDRVLVSDSFAQNWRAINTHVLPRVTSDHSPLVFQCSGSEVRRRNSFRFLTMWTSHDNFLEVVEQSWNQQIQTRCPIFRVMAKLRRLRGVLKSWNKEVFGNVDVSIGEMGDKLAEIQERISASGYTDELFNEEIAAQAGLNVILSRKNEFLRQKSRINWLQDGDRNSSFFHNMIKFRKQHLNIGHLQIDGVVTTDSGRIERHIIDYFSQLFKETDNRWVETVELEAIIEHSISDNHNDMLISLPEEVEISAAVHSMESSSAPRPDGFSGAFFHSCWKIVKDDVVSAVRAFFRKSYLPNGCNASTLILIPKKEEVVTVADLRPIILSNFFFKIISKILASRRSVIAARCVSNNQFGFIAGRSIHDCIMLGSEGFNCMKRVNRGSNMACKIDIRKAFDTMSWSFILQVLRVFGFHEKFVNWISIIFHSARISILYNGQLSGYFS
ncbi:uncharacterized protein LOC131008375 [Salvia miltiorrhiza]|uniref:uncharacterized protein LOC131008375 n=1 Tax=Salvia miltiorrhiza TaxID=226208 RepID=UPI0025ACD9DE|nr:uncharacterized protein LOC131008375 [Salvia miltiorrhiza]